MRAPAWTPKTAAHHRAMLRLPIILISTAAKTPTPYHYTVYQAPPASHRGAACCPDTIPRPIAPPAATR